MVLTALDGTTLPPETTAGKVVLFVNVASFCGATPQYQGLQALHEQYADRGFTVVGVPCNQFGAQEPGSPEEIVSFCSLNYGVTFPLLAKQDVNGPDRSPLFRALVGDGPDIRWNFEKFLVDRDGRSVARFGTRVVPEADELRQAVEAVL